MSPSKQRFQNLSKHLFKQLLILGGLGIGLGTHLLMPASAQAERMRVSWYGPGFDGSYTANGEIFSRYDYTAAHPHWPFDTVVQLTNPNTGAVVTVRVNDRSGGALDISEQAARDLGTYSSGIAPVDVEILQWGE
ncbi:MAG: septal ring lytic transglycosylase RlpA family protein [Cyanobacteria bacterium J06614_10]